VTRHVSRWVDYVRWLVVICVLALVASFLEPVPMPEAAEAAVVPRALAGAGPVDRPAPVSVRPDRAVSRGSRPPVVVSGCRLPECDRI
jgi:hypothetical protein